MIQKRGIELLAPAKDYLQGIEAIKHGADAVYIGANSFGARAAAANSVESIAELVEFAHQYYAKVYVTVNTILKEEELKRAERLIWDLYDIGVDAIIVQDMGILMMNLPPIELHASTQIDIRDAEKVRFLYEVGFTRVVLARELSLSDIQEIHNAVPEMQLEIFVHGALCVSYSGQCYASQYCFGRSANRGECAQFCRLPFDLYDAAGRCIEHRFYPLSLKDMSRVDYLKEILASGVVSLKIEGRLKDMSYVKNVVAGYNIALNRVIDEGESYYRTSSGSVSYSFEPNLEKSFNRGYTDYLLHGRTTDLSTGYTPKAMGEYMGVVHAVGLDWLTVSLSGGRTFHNGDGVCFIAEDGELWGYRVNRVEGDRIYLFIRGAGRLPTIVRGTRLYRNSDVEFETLLSKESANRRVAVTALLSECDTLLTLSYRDENGNVGSSSIPLPTDMARDSQHNNIVTQLSKLGSTIFEAESVTIKMRENRFIPSSALSSLRRNAIDNLLRNRKQGYVPTFASGRNSFVPYVNDNLNYLANISNTLSMSFYRKHAVKQITGAYEIAPVNDAVLMRCRHCVRYMLGECPKYGGKPKHKIPYTLRSMDGRTFRLIFECDRCEMIVKSDN